MKLFGTYPSPYGVAVPVHQADGSEDTLFSVEAVATIAGIYAPEQRKLFKQDATRFGRFPENLANYGGRRAYRVPLPRPAMPATPQVPSRELPDIPLDAWVNAVMDQSRWCDRADALVLAIESNFTRHEDNVAFAPVLGIGLQILLTSALEHLAEKEIDCLEAAGMYALSVHQEWSAAGLRWLEPVAKTWWSDWIEARPAISRLAALCDLLPDWFGRSA